MIGYTIVNIVGTVVLIAVAPTASTKGGLLVAFYFMQCFQAVSPSMYAMLSRNIAGQTKKSITYALFCECLAPFSPFPNPVLPNLLRFLVLVLQRLARLPSLTLPQSSAGPEETPSALNSSSQSGGPDTSTACTSTWGSTHASSSTCSPSASCSAAATRGATGSSSRLAGSTSTRTRSKT